MTDYLSYRFNDNEAFVSSFDELPLWSASFGLLLLKHLEIRSDITVIDIGSGTGFPLLELAARLGNTCKLYGIDPWVNANRRAKEKIGSYGLTNVEIMEQAATSLPFGDVSIDLAVSNLGLNNFEDAPSIFRECYRVLKPGGKLAITTNVAGHWTEFYSIFYETLSELNKEQLIAVLKMEEQHRGTTASISKLFTDEGFKISRCYEERFEMSFADGTSFLNHHFVKLGWLNNWTSIFPKDELYAIFSTLEHNLNRYAKQSGHLRLSVPMRFIEGVK